MNLFERLYYAGFSLKQRYATGRRKRLPFRVISIGNLTTGGTGKTPATIAIAKEALARGLSPIILTRGYRGKAKGPCFVTKGEAPLLTAEEAGDEPLLMASRLRGVPIVKGPDRYESGTFAIEALGLNQEQGSSGTIFLLDDGFQHFRLYRDLDIVLIDGEHPFGRGRLLPTGRLREPLTSLCRANTMVITKGRNTSGSSGPDTEMIFRTVRKHNPSAKVHSAGHLPVTAGDSKGTGHPVSIIAGEPVFGFCGIASPDSFQRTLTEAGAVISGFRSYPDHHSYKASDIALVAKEAEESKCRWIVTTEKDIIKIGHLDLPENTLIIGIEFCVDSSFFDQILG